MKKIVALVIAITLMLSAIPALAAWVSMSPRLDTQSRSGWTVAAEKMDSRGVSVGH